MESTSDSEDPEIINGVAEPLLKRVFKDKLDFKLLAKPNQEEYIDKLVSGLSVKEAINLWSDLRAVKSDFGSMTVELRNLQMALKRKVRIRKPEKRRPMNSKKSDNNDGMRRYGRKQMKSDESFSEMSDVQILDALDNNEENKNGERNEEMKLSDNDENRKTSEDQPNAENNQKTSEDKTNIGNNKKTSDDEQTSEENKEKTDEQTIEEDTNTNNTKHTNAIITDSRQTECNTSRELMKYNDQLQQLSKFMQSGNTRLNWGDVVHVEELADNYRLRQTLINDEDTTYLSLLQGQKSKNYIIVATENLSAQIRNGCAKGYLKLNNLEYLSVFCHRWTFCDFLEESDKRTRCLAELEKRSFALHKTSMNMWWTLQQKGTEDRSQDGLYSLTSSYANFQFKEVKPVQKTRWLRYYCVAVIQ